MTGIALTAHGLCDARKAEALILEWFDCEGLELVYIHDGVLIACGDMLNASSHQEFTKVVEVRVYPLAGGCIQVRWSMLHPPDLPRPTWALRLLEGLRLRLEADPLWHVDGP